MNGAAAIPATLCHNYKTRLRFKVKTTKNPPYPGWSAFFLTQESFELKLLHATPDPTQVSRFGSCFRRRPGEE